MSISILLKSFLDENQISYSVMTHATAYTAQGAAATMQISAKELAKTVVLWTGEEMILAVRGAISNGRPYRDSNQLIFGSVPTDALIYWSAQLPGGRLLRSYRRKSFAVTRCMVADHP